MIFAKRSTRTDATTNATAGAGSGVVRRFRWVGIAWPWLAAIASGILYAACFSPFDQAWLCWIALTPLISAVWFARSTSRRPWLRNLLLGYLAGVVFFTITFYWLGSLGFLFDNVALRGLSLLLSLYLAMHLAFWAWFVGLVRLKTFHASYRNLAVAFVGASAWVTHEWTRGWLFGGFGWNGLGVALHAQWPLIQIAQFTGVSGVSFAAAFANVIAVTVPFRLFAEARTQRMRPHWDLNLTVLALVAMFVFGWRTAQPPAAAKSVHVAAVQPGIEQKQKFNPESAATIYDQISELGTLAFQSKPTPDIVVWPESAVPGDWLDQGVRKFVTGIASQYDVDLLFGIDDVDLDHAYNAAVLVPARGGEAQVYHKIHLVPFGEYVPLRHSFPLFAAVAGRWVPGDFGFGNEYSVFRLTNSSTQLAPLICFEDTVGELARRFVQRDADLLVNITNDGWFLHSAASRQHLANAVFRCVENRRPMLRAANTGVTCFVNEFGRVTQILRDDTGSTFGAGVLTGKIDSAQDRQLTFYTRHGEFFAECCAVITAITIAVVVAMRRFVIKS